jgi:hypothetical protein
MQTAAVRLPFFIAPTELPASRCKHKSLGTVKVFMQAAGMKDSVLAFQSSVSALPVPPDVMKQTKGCYGWRTSVVFPRIHGL